MKATITLDFDGSPKDVHLLIAVAKALAAPSPGLVMSTGPVTIHCPEGLEEEAKKAWSTNEDVKEEDVQVHYTDREETFDKEQAEREKKPKTKKAKKEEPKPVVPENVTDGIDPAPEVNDEEERKVLNEKARGLLLSVTKKGIGLSDIRKRLSEEIGGDVTKLDVPGLKKAIELLEAM